MKNEKNINLLLLKEYKVKKCVYTFIIGDYDTLKPPTVITPDWDYICVTDNPNLKSDVWRIIQIDEVDKKIQPAKRRAMSLMIGHQKYLPNHYDIIITVIGQAVINIDLNRLLKKYGYNNKYDACLCEHPNRNCVYDEGEKIIEVHRDTPERINEHLQIYKNIGYPRNNGLYASGIMIINNNSKNIKTYFNQWLSDYQSLPSIRDQMTMNYSEWRLQKDKDIKLKIKLIHFQKLFEHDEDISLINSKKSHKEAMQFPTPTGKI